MPLLSFDVYPASGAPAPSSASAGEPMTLVARRREGEDEDDEQKKGWLTYAPLGVLLFILILPHPSYLITLTSFYLKTRHAPWRFGVHLLAVHALTLGALASLVVCVVRDPGGIGRGLSARNGQRSNNYYKNGSRVGSGPKKKNTARLHERDADRDTEDGVTTSLLQGGGESESYGGDVRDAVSGDVEDGYDVHDGDLAVGDDGQGDAASSSLTNTGINVDIDALSLNGRWCRQCRCARPERAHHCGACGRCVLKMDHHCPWMGGNCVGYRTYPAFIHFLLMATLLAAYIACISLSVVIYLISDPFSIDPHTSPLHPLFLLLIGAVFTLVMGSFLLYHVYLMTTNQTTREHMSPFLLLRYIPPPPPPSPDGPPAYETPPHTPYGSRDPRTYTHIVQPPFIDSTAHASSVSPVSQMPLQLLELEPATAATRNPHTTARPFRTTLAYRPPDEHDLSPAQRRVVQHVHGQVRLYDLGWRRNLGEVFGGGRPKGDGGGYGGGGETQSWVTWWVWVGLLVTCGGRPRGDGRTFERGRGAKRGLERLVRGLEDVRRSDGRGWRWIQS